MSSTPISGTPIVATNSSGSTTGIDPVDDDPIEGVGDAEGTEEGTETGEVEAEEEGGRAKGAIRNLLNGHYSAVAALRLSINFAAELSALQTAETSLAASAGGTGLTGAIEASVDTYTASQEITEAQGTAVDEAQVAFATAVDEAQVGVGGDADSLATLRVDLTSSFEAFSGLLADILSAGETEEPSVLEGIEGVEATEDPEGTIGTTESGETESADAGLQAYLDELSALFASELETLIASLEGSSASAVEFGEPNGNGAAYDKFLAIYQGLSDTTSTTESTDGDVAETETTDTEPVETDPVDPAPIDLTA